MKKFFILLSFVLLALTACMTWFDTKEDISIIVQVPDTLIIKNNARVSTLRYVEGFIFRNNDKIHTFRFNCDIVASDIRKIKLADVILQDGDTVSVYNANFSNDM